MRHDIQDACIGHGADGAGLFDGLSGGFAGHLPGGHHCKVGENRGMCATVLYWVVTWFHVIPTW